MMKNSIDFTPFNKALNVLNSVRIKKLTMDDLINEMAFDGEWGEFDIQLLTDSGFQYKSVIVTGNSDKSEFVQALFEFENVLYSVDLLNFTAHFNTIVDTLKVAA